MPGDGYAAERGKIAELCGGASSASRGTGYAGTDHNRAAKKGRTPPAAVVRALANGGLTASAGGGMVGESGTLQPDAAGF